VKYNFESSSISSGLGDSSSVSFLDLQSGKEVFSFKAEQALAPASTLKLLTSVAALKDLGESFSFKTGVFLLPSSSSRVFLGIKGGGDPELTTEQIYLLVRKIKLLGIRNISELVLDASALQDPSDVQGQRAYQAGSTALSFNFNSVGFQICSGIEKRVSKATVLPLIWEDPVKVVSEVSVVPGSEARISLSFSNPGLVKAAGSIGQDSPCVIRYLSNQNVNSSLGNFLRDRLEEEGLGNDIVVSSAIIPSSANNLFEFESKSLSQLLIGLNHFSTNVSAEQILAAIGSAGEPYQLSRARGLEYIRRFMTGLGFKDCNIEDGSGLSRNNRLSSSAITSVLRFAWNNSEIRPFLEVSLPILGQSGTLKKRLTPKGDYHVFAKSGTLDGVSALAGYLHVATGKSYAFSIIQNNVAEIEGAHRMEETIIQKFVSRLPKLD
jgi:D-alanyl-D-alanine carboxypeptidase/D-alanyl-D-alanine-endopeptidase (penicillin-binding protein 4)